MSLIYLPVFDLPVPELQSLINLSLIYMSTVNLSLIYLTVSDLPVPELQSLIYMSPVNQSMIYMAPVNLSMIYLPVSDVPVPELPGVGDDPLPVLLPDHKVRQVPLSPPPWDLFDGDLGQRNQAFNTQWTQKRMLQKDMYTKECKLCITDKYEVHWNSIYFCSIKKFTKTN